MAFSQNSIYHTCLIENIDKKATDFRTLQQQINVKVSIFHLFFFSCFDVLLERGLIQQTTLKYNKFIQNTRKKTRKSPKSTLYQICQTVCFKLYIVFLFQIHTVFECGSICKKNNNII